MPEDEYVKVKKSVIIAAKNLVFMGQQDIIEKRMNILNGERFGEEEQKKLRHYDKLEKIYDKTRKELAEVL